MYIGDTRDGSGFQRMLYEVLHNALHEAVDGHCDRIDIELNADGSATVRDNGRGIPTGERDGKSVPVLVMTELHMMGWLARNYVGNSRELQGVGVAVVNALSEMLDLRIRRDGLEHHLVFRRGVPDGPVAIAAKTSATGTEMRFLPDPEIFPGQRFAFERMETHIRSLAHLSTGAVVSITDRREPEPRSVLINV